MPQQSLPRLVWRARWVASVWAATLKSSIDAKFTMRVVDSDTDAAVELGELLISVLDMDINLPNVVNGKEMLIISVWSDYSLIPRDTGGQSVVTKLGEGHVSLAFRRVWKLTTQVTQNRGSEQ